MYKRQCETPQELEGHMLELLADGDPKRVAKIADLDKFVCKTGVFGVCEYKRNSEEKSQYLNGHGGKNKKIMKAFYGV